MCSRNWNEEEGKEETEGLKRNRREKSRMVEGNTITVFMLVVKSDSLQ